LIEFDRYPLFTVLPQRSLATRQRQLARILTNPENANEISGDVSSLTPHLSQTYASARIATFSHLQ
jgi:hypothetical protein